MCRSPPLRQRPLQSQIGRSASAHAGLSVSLLKSFQPKFLLEIGDRLADSFLQADSRLPAQYRERPGDVRLPALGVIFAPGCRSELNASPIAGQVIDGFGKLKDSCLHRIAYIDRFMFRGHQQSIDAVDQIVNVTKTARLRAIALNG